MARVLFVSKPVVPPWNDSGKNLVKDLALSLRRHVPTVMTRIGEELAGPQVRSLPLYRRDAGGFAPALRDQARVFAALLAEREHALWHFFFAPNSKSCVAGALSRRLRRRPCVHTVSSSPRDPSTIVPKLFADLHVVLSGHTEGRLRQAGLAAERLVRIAPCIAPLSPLSAEQRSRARVEFELPIAAPLLVYPGDLEFGGGAQLCLDALAALSRKDAILVMACRAKTSSAAAAESALRARAHSAGLDSRVVWVGETRSIHALLGASDIVALPSTDLYAKMDYPLVALEAMSLRRPVVVAEGTAAAELCATGGALAIAADAQALASAWSRLLDDDSAAQALGVQGERDVRDRYSPAAMARAYEAVYDRLL